MTATASAMDEISSIQASVKASWKHLDSKKRQAVEEHTEKRQGLSKAITEGVGVPTASEAQNLRKEWWSIATTFKSELETLDAECHEFVVSTQAAMIAVNEIIDSWVGAQAQELSDALGMHQRLASIKVKEGDAGREILSRENSVRGFLSRAASFLDDNAKLIAGIDAELAEKSRQWRVI